MGIEFEYKFLLDETNRDRVATHPQLCMYKIAETAEHRLISTYYDTPDHGLQHKRMALRVRTLDKGFMQTIKGEAHSVNGFTKRDELEWPVAADALDWSKLSGSKFSALLAELGEPASYQPVFRTVFTRKIRVVDLPDRTRVEVALDEGYIEAGGLREPIHELELEILEGSVTTLAVYANNLREALNLQPGDVSKAQRGYELHARAQRAD